MPFLGMILSRWINFQRWIQGPFRSACFKQAVTQDAVNLNSNENHQCFTHTHSLSLSLSCALTSIIGKRELMEKAINLFRASVAFLHQAATTYGLDYIKSKAPPF